MSDKVRFTLVVGKEMVKEYDEMADSIGISRSALILIAMKNYLDQQKAIKYAPGILDMAKQIDDMQKLKKIDLP